jgi:predicted dinucleotide-utilizing enzyme
VRVGIIGYGFIGQHVVRSILDSGPLGAGLELAFVHIRQTAKLAGLPGPQVCGCRGSSLSKDCLSG